MAKLFKDLTDKDSLYYLNPITDKIDAFKIKTITGVSPEQAAQRESLKYWVRIEVFQNVLALHSPDIEKIPTIVFFFDGRQPGQVAVVGTQLEANNRYKVPTIFAASKSFISEWRRTTS